VRKFKTQNLIIINLIIIGYVFFLIILFLPLLSYTRDTAENPNRQSSQNEVRKVNLKEVMRFSDVPEKEIYFKRPSNIKLDDNGNIYITVGSKLVSCGRAVKVYPSQTLAVYLFEILACLGGDFESLLSSCNHKTIVPYLDA